MSDLPAFWNHNRFDPVFWVCAVGVAVSMLLLALMPVMVAEYAPPDDPLPCPKAFHDARCTSEMGRAR